MTIDSTREKVWLLDIWQKSGSAKEQAQVIDRAFELAKTILEASDA